MMDHGLKTGRCRIAGLAKDFRLAPLLALLALCLLAVPGTAVARQSTPLVPVSVSSAGQAADGSARDPSISDDGRFIAFTSGAENLVAGDSNALPDIFVHDRQLGETTRVSVSTVQEEANGASGNPSLSGNGRFVAFESAADNLVPGDTNQQTDIFVHDRLLGITERVSLNSRGEQADGWSAAASISDDGRHVSFVSAAANLVPGDTNQQADIFLYHRVTGKTLRISIASDGAQGNGPSSMPAISGDGTVIAYVSESDNLVTGDTNGQADVFVYQRLLAETRRISLSAAGGQAEGWSGSPMISDNGQYVAFVSAASLTAGIQPGVNIFVHDTWNNLTRQGIAVSQELSQVRAALSGNGRMLAYWRSGSAGGEWVWHDLRSGESGPLPVDAVELSLDLSFEGTVAALTTAALIGDGIEQVAVFDRRPAPKDTYFISGRVTDVLGTPLAVVSVADGRGRKTRTDGLGYFFLGGVPAGDTSLSFTKEGYRFDPQQVNLETSRDLNGLKVRFVHDKILVEARKDIGMPYSNDRGCEGSNYYGCGGPFHGFNAGYCTDLVLDAYNFGVEFSIQIAIERDVRANPHHYYYWPSARDSHDMWRYFSYNGQIRYGPPYLPGDIVFFDWTEDGELDHTALVSQVDEFGNATFLLDATGVIDSNPSGLAAELPWEPFHDRTARGHARWSGAYEPPVTGFPPGVQVLQMALSGGQVSLRLLDEAGRAISLTEDQIPGGTYLDLTWEDVITVVNPTLEDQRFTLEIRAHGEGRRPYWFNVHLLQEGRQVGHTEVFGGLEGGQILRLPLYLSMDEEGSPQIEAVFPGRQPKIRGRFRQP